MLCLGILWNGMYEYKESAIRDIQEYANVIDFFSIDLGQDYENFVRDIYDLNEIAKWKVDKKIETMFSCSEKRIITVVIMNIETNQQYFHELKKRMVYANLESMKVNIRKKYSNLVSYYFFDNLLHATDDENEYFRDYNIVKKYAKEKGIFSEDKKVKKKEKTNDES